MWERCGGVHLRPAGLIVAGVPRQELVAGDEALEGVVLIAELCVRERDAWSMPQVVCCVT